MPTSKLSTKGWIVIPKELRKKYGLKPGRLVSLIDFGGGIYLYPVPDDPIAAARGMFADGPSLTDELLAERRRDKEREDAELAYWAPKHAQPG